LHRWCDIIQDGDFLKLDFEEAEYEGAEASSPERKWYVVHTYSGYENKVKANLEKRVESMNMEHQIFNVIIPEEDEIEYKGGQRKVTKRRIFPGYVMVDMILSDDSWMTVRHTPGVIGFVGSGTKPIPLQKQEVDKILRHMGLIGGKPKIDVQVGQHVRVKSGLPVVYVTNGPYVYVRFGPFVFLLCHYLLTFPFNFKRCFLKAISSDHNFSGYIFRYLIII
jgi:transcriptional antiterminator NusG